MTITVHGCRGPKFSLQTKVIITVPSNARARSREKMSVFSGNIEKNERMSLNSV